MVCARRRERVLRPDVRQPDGALVSRGTLVFVFKFPADIVYTRMFPGTAFGVLVGDLVYTWMAFRLARRTGSRT